MAQRPHQQRQQSALSGISWLKGLSAGFGAFVLVTITIGVFLFVEISSAMSQFGGMGGLGGFGGLGGTILVIVGFGLVYGSHIGAVASTSLGMASGFTTIPIFVYYLVPIVVLVWFGRRVAKASDVHTPGGGAAAGASIALGYLAGLILSVVVILSMLPPFASGGGIGSQSLRVVFVVGIAYPAIFGGIGGLTATMSASAGGRQGYGGGGQRSRGHRRQQAGRQGAQQPQGQYQQGQAAGGQQGGQYSQAAGQQGGQRQGGGRQHGQGGGQQGGQRQQRQGQQQSQQDDRSGQ